MTLNLNRGLYIVPMLLSLLLLFWVLLQRNVTLFFTINKNSIAERSPLGMERLIREIPA